MFLKGTVNHRMHVHSYHPVIVTFMIKYIYTYICMYKIKRGWLIEKCLFKKDFVYLFLGRREGREKERESNINMWLPLTCPLLGPGPQPRHVPWLGIEPATLWFTGWCSIHLSHTSQGKKCVSLSGRITESGAVRHLNCEGQVLTEIGWGSCGWRFLSHVLSTADTLMVESWAESTTLLKLFTLYLFCYLSSHRWFLLFHAHIKYTYIPWTRGFGFWMGKLWVPACALIPMTCSVPNPFLYLPGHTFSGSLATGQPCDSSLSSRLWMVEMSATSRPGMQSSCLIPHVRGDLWNPIMSTTGPGGRRSQKEPEGARRSQVPWIATWRRATCHSDVRLVWVRNECILMEVTEV